MNDLVATRHSPGPSKFALRFFASTIGVVALAAGIAKGLVWLSGGRVAQQLVPPVFWGTTLLLAAGSFELHRAVASVRRERQRPFRRALIAALATGTLFVGLQSYGLWCLLQFPEATDAQTGIKAFVFMLTFLHGMHFTVALGFLVFITLRALADRYDHEYYWGVAACGYFWHCLGLVWIAILAVFAIASTLKFSA
jgi:cytochrome c oxidase subunit 3